MIRSAKRHLWPSYSDSPPNSQIPLPSLTVSPPVSPNFATEPWSSWLPDILHACDILARMQARTRGFLTGCLFGALVVGVSAKVKPGKQFLNTGGEKPPGYTHVVTSPPGKTIFISGRGGMGSDGKMPADFAEQATNTFEDLKRCLALAGAGFRDVVKINYYVTDIANTAELRRIRARYLDMEHAPAATLVQVGLAPGALLEVEAIATLPE